MPVILGDKRSIHEWLTGSSSSKFETLLKPYEDKDLAWYPLTPAMGKPSFDGPDCIKETIKSKEVEHKPEIETKVEEQTETYHPKSLKEEDAETPDQNEDEQKPHVSSLHCQEAINVPIKRDYDEISADTNQLGSEAKIPPQSNPPKMKGNTGSAGDKQQPTLFSYFSKI